MYEVKDNKRMLKFDGVMLAFSTSYKPGSVRWIEFTLYRTLGGEYVLARVGETRMVHRPDCSLAERSGLPPIPAVAAKEGSIPCELCKPNLARDEEIAAELPRYWVQRSDTAEAIVEALYKYDENGARYLTGVAERLLEEASKLDAAIEECYRIETIL